MPKRHLCALFPVAQPVGRSSFRIVVGGRGGLAGIEAYHIDVQSVVGVHDVFGLPADAVDVVSGDSSSE